MASPPTDERSQVLDAAMTPWEGLTAQELALVEALEEVRRLAKVLHLNVQELRAPLALRIDAWLWRSSRWLRP